MVIALQRGNGNGERVSDEEEQDNALQNDRVERKSAYEIIKKRRIFIEHLWIYSCEQ